ncbi:flagellar basal body P-ring formation protein FlgA [Methylomonas sp. LL1]|uniref:flagellar basal body P-ring formation chaperone FlgA n=1 Tax=Methylomonas sp. LL1 TaxID=2785785 RepID=UPI0018C42975|nr:flagellar basal body P-ring formation chaperone FlgA [Methylomonas sp. LL1]QPK61911.1 flagellar basal body P-ring formation protein FlgA [Methylomonas sp. LL1]
MKTINLYLCLLLLLDQACLASPVQSLQAIQDAVNNFAQTALEPGGNYQINTLQIDPRLQLPACEQNLDIFAQSGELKPGRNTIGIRCSGSSNWTIYSTVLIKSFKEVLVLTKPLNKNETINPEQLKIETRDTATLQQGYISNLEEVINKQTTRFIPAGSVLTRMHYAEPTLIRRGERVNIQSGKAGLMITTAGIAMADGIKGQQISIKNASSKRIIQATVINPGLVSVSF